MEHPDGTIPPDHSVGPKTLAALFPLFSLALAVYLVRMWTRSRPTRRLNAADYAVTVAMIGETVAMVLTSVAVANGFGRPVPYLSPGQIDTIGYTTAIAAAFGFVTSCVGRISVAALLLGITQSRAWKIALWLTLVFQLLLLVSCITVISVQCRPLRAKWANVPGAKCITVQQNWIMGYVFISSSMVSDVLFATMPILLVWGLTRSKMEKLLLSVLLGLGLLGVIAGGVKLQTLKLFRVGSKNIVAEMMPVYMWSRIEEIVIIAAACAPLLKTPIENLLHRWFGIRFYPNVRDLYDVYALPDDQVGKGRCLQQHRGSHQPSSEDMPSDGWGSEQGKP